MEGAGEEREGKVEEEEGKAEKEGGKERKGKEGFAPMGAKRAPRIAKASPFVV